MIVKDMWSKKNKMNRMGQFAKRGNTVAVAREDRANKTNGNKATVDPMGKPVFCQRCLLVVPSKNTDLAHSWETRPARPKPPIYKARVSIVKTKEIATQNSNELSLTSYWRNGDLQINMTDLENGF
jgi:hypothetical protein